MARWTFSDGTTTVTVDVNPNAGGSPHFTKQFDRAPLTAPGTFPVLFEGRPSAPKGSFDGVCRTRTHYDMLNTWFNKPQLTVADDLGRTFSIAPSGLRWKMSPTRQSNWRGTYTFEYVLLTPAAV